MAAKPIKTLELHFPMIQFLIDTFICDERCRLATNETILDEAAEKGAERKKNAFYLLVSAWVRS